jgi:hypothetical protein
VTVYGWPATYIKFNDDHGTLLDMAVNPVWAGRVIREFRAHGYPGRRLAAPAPRIPAPDLSAGAAGARSSCTSPSAVAAPAPSPGVTPASSPPLPLPLPLRTAELRHT